MNRKADFAQSSLYVLKHKDLDVAMVQINSFTGKIEYVLEVYLREELPVGCRENTEDLCEWWESRAIPDSRRGIQQMLNQLEEESSLSLMLSAYGLSLTDHYWLQPIGKELYWKDLNFYENEFSDELGNLLTDSEKIDIHAHISKFSPSASVNGEMKKKWVIKDETRYLMKVNANDYGQQAVNEIIACRLHEKQGWGNFVPYTIQTAVIEGKEIPCSVNPLFTSSELELVSAYQLIRNYKVPQDCSDFEAVIHLAVEKGMNETEVRRQLEYTILTDFILTNTDRHFNNFGFLYSSAEHKLVAMAPIYDTGNALFYNKAVIPQNENLLKIKVSSFSKREVSMLRYISDKGCVDLNCLIDFPTEAEELLTEYTCMPKERAGEIAQTIRQKIEYLKLFQQGKKIWKQKAYW